MPFFFFFGPGIVFPFGAAKDPAVLGVGFFERLPARIVSDYFQVISIGVIEVNGKGVAPTSMRNE
jgi:hypothetical protein